MTAVPAQPPAVLHVPCFASACEAKPGERCRVEYGPRTRQPHQTRLETAALVDPLLGLLADVAAKATPYGEQDGEFVATYILPTGPIHRILATLGEYGRPVPLPPGSAL